MWYNNDSISNQGGMNMPSKLPNFSVRLSEDILDKMRYIADFNSRSINKELEWLAKSHIKSFELEHGVISEKDIVLSKAKSR